MHYEALSVAMGEVVEAGRLNSRPENILKILLQTCPDLFDGI